MSALAASVTGVIGDSGEHVGEPSLRVHVIELRGRDQRGHDSGAVSALSEPAKRSVWGRSGCSGSRRGGLPVPGLAEFRDRRVRDADLGRLDQQSPLMQPIGSIPPAEAEARYAMINEQKLAAWLEPHRQTRGGSFRAPLSIATC
jgi:hypothetical protein